MKKYILLVLLLVSFSFSYNLLDADKVTHTETSYILSHILDEVVNLEPVDNFILILLTGLAWETYHYNIDKNNKPDSQDMMSNIIGALLYHLSCKIDIF